MTETVSYKIIPININILRKAYFKLRSLNVTHIKMDEMILIMKKLAIGDHKLTPNYTFPRQQKIYLPFQKLYFIMLGSFLFSSRYAWDRGSIVDRLWNVLLLYSSSCYYISMLSGSLYSPLPPLSLLMMSWTRPLPPLDNIWFGGEAYNGGGMTYSGYKFDGAK